MSTPETEKEQAELVEKVLESVRPGLQADGGDVELVDIQDGEVFVRMLGACGGCMFSTVTLQMGVEAALKKELPWVTKVTSV